MLSLKACAVMEIVNIGQIFGAQRILVQNGRVRMMKSRPWNVTGDVGESALAVKRGVS